MDVIASAAPKKSGRLYELDYMKCVFILLMVTFHLTFVSDTFPFAKGMVYTFHMPGFLLISGYLMNVSKPAGAFMRTILWLLVPYLIMESGYIVMASVLPINEHIDHLTSSLFLYRLLVKPLGPYWYLQAMVLCGVVYYAASRLIRGAKLLRALLCVGASYGLAQMEVLSFPCAMYFFAGVVIRMYQLDIKEVFPARKLSFLFLVLLMVDWANLDKATAGGVAIVYFVMSALMYLYGRTPHFLRGTMLWMGRNTLPIFLFSPIFTVLCKVLLVVMPAALPQPLQAVLFITVSLPICVGGSVMTARILECTGLSMIMFGKRAVVTR